MKFHIPLLATALVSSVTAAETPRIFAGLLEKDIPVAAQVGIVLPPPEIDKYLAKVRTAAHLDPKWFEAYSAESKPYVPLPFHEKLGLTKEEYDEYRKLWAKREFKPTENVELQLRETLGGAWILAATGEAGIVSLLRFHAKDDVFRSPNGDLKRLDDIKADADSILGAWTGFEWKFEEETTLSKTKENLALGRMDGNKYGLVVYRFQEVPIEGSRMVDKSLVIRFLLGKAGHLKPPIPKAKPAEQPETTPATKPKPKPTAKPATKR
ncbi:MAG: hypothetical protein NTW21_14325 [Verrucomicrobia bacterium]|nr:hypothetical protein [Verrucomicrobiota bacterium]